jgi:hypothetical protein
MMVYRVENRNREGPYSGRLTTDLSHHYNAVTHPGPWDDGLGRSLYSYHRFGFSSLEMMRVWFNADDRRGLRTDGYHLAAYEVPPSHVKHGSKQIIFDHYEAKLVERFDLVDEIPISILDPTENGDDQ